MVISLKSPIETIIDKRKDDTQTIRMIQYFHDMGIIQQIDGINHTTAALNLAGMSQCYRNPPPMAAFETITGQLLLQRSSANMFDA